MPPMPTRAPLCALISLLSVGALTGCFVSDDELKERSDYDGDGVPLGEDCDDTRADIGAVVSWFSDVDGDGFGAGEEQSGCPDEKPATNTADNADDCDDSNPSAFPGAEERYYDGVDQDCAGEDADGNGSVDDFDQDGDGYEQDVDCDDLDPSLKPDDSIEEVYYDGIDNDCNLDTGDGDKDGDGYWSADYRSKAPDSDLSSPSGFFDDCYDDADSPEQPADALNGLDSLAPDQVNPGIMDDAPYDGIDARCDGDDGEFDADGDGYFSAAYVQRDGVVGGDCQDCTSACAGEPLWAGSVDSADIYPGAAEAYYDGVDQDCAGIDSVNAGIEDDFDQDGDGHVIEGAVDAFDNLGDDCLDTDARLAPGNVDVPLNGLDEDCGGENDYDLDLDGYVPDAYFSLLTVGVPGSDTTPGGDCVNDPAFDSAFVGYPASAFNPAQIDAWGDGQDTDCAGNDDFDHDGDGYRGEKDYGTRTDLSTSQQSLTIVFGDATTVNDCDDDDAAVFPGAVAEASSSECMLDSDGDGYGDDAAVAPYEAGTDCDDADSAVNPGVAEVAANGIDDNCDGGAAPEGIEGVNDASQYAGAVYGEDIYGFGWELAAGDLDGDGQLELVVSEPYHSAGSSYEGRVSWYDPADFLATEHGGNSYSGAVDGDQGYDQIGNDLFVGDLTGDGVDDLLVAASDAVVESSYDGRIYLFAGPLSGSSSSPFEAAAADADYVASGTAGNQLGYAISAGEVTGDSYVDLVASEPFADMGDRPLYSAGALHIWTPQTGSAEESDKDAVTLSGDTSYYYLGYGDILIEDTDGDGVNEVIIGSPYATSTEYFEGMVDVISTPVVDTLPVGDFRVGSVIGDSDSANCGTSVAVGDVDNDGYVDLAVGCPGLDSNNGAVILVYNDGSPEGFALASYSDADLIVEGAGLTGSSMGTQVSFGDVDGDGVVELLASEPYYTSDSATYDGGRVVMVFGGTSGTMSADDADGLLQGDTAYGYFGTAIATGSDFDGDGNDDLVVGRIGSNVDGDNHGDALLFTGGEW